eukprot:531529-Alexandrium_andersonii.AAC.1
MQGCCGAHMRESQGRARRTLRHTPAQGQAAEHGLDARPGARRAAGGAIVQSSRDSCTKAGP